MRRFLCAGVLPALFTLMSGAAVARAADPDTTRVVENEAKYGMVISATRTERAETEVPAGSLVIRGETLRGRGIRSVADAIHDVTGIDAGDGSDNGSRLPNIGMWGLKEFDALLVCVDGVPVGGPFNPALEQIPIEQIDRIEILKGPQGTLYGVSAFAGMISIFTRPTGHDGFEFTQRFDSFNQAGGDVSWNGAVRGGTRIRASAGADQGDGFQDRTGFSRFRSTVALSRPVGKGQASLTFNALQDRQQWGAPLPYDAGEILPGFSIDRNTAVGGAAADHLVFGLNGAMQWPLGAATRLEGNLGVTSDKQKLVRSFVDAATIVGDQVDADGQRILPTETTMYVDARAIHNTNLAGPHEIVGGAALTWGKLRASIEEFDMTFTYTPVPIVPDISERPINEGGDVETERHFFGAYVHDTWTPHPRFTVGAGGRVDLTGEELESEDEVTQTQVKDSKEDTGWSGDGTLLVRTLSIDPERGNVLNLYASARRNFKPSAPNVTEPEGAKILEPETSVGYEGGLKARAWAGQVSLDGSVFQMVLENQVVTVQDASGNPALANAGKTQYRGEEVSLTVAPKKVPGLKVVGGYAHHDPKFISFTRPDGSSVDGKRPELAPQELWNVGASWTGGPRRFTVWAASRGAGESFFNRRNTFIVPSWSEWDAGVSVETGVARWSVSGKNLSDERHVVTESEVGDSQFYIAAPRRIAAAVTVKI